MTADPGHPRPHTLRGILLVMSAVFIRPGGGQLTPAAIFPLCSALAFSLYQIITRKIGRRENPLTTLF